MASNIINNYSYNRVKMKLEKRPNGLYVWTSLMFEIPCNSLMEVFKQAKEVIQMPLATVELALLELEKNEDDYAEFDEYNCFIKTGKYNN